MCSHLLNRPKVKPAFEERVHLHNFTAVPTFVVSTNQVLIVLLEREIVLLLNLKLALVLSGNFSIEWELILMGLRVLWLIVLIAFIIDIDLRH